MEPFPNKKTNLGSSFIKRGNVEAMKNEKRKLHLWLPMGLGILVGIAIAAGVTNGEVFRDLVDPERAFDSIFELFGSSSICATSGAILWLS